MVKRATEELPQIEHSYVPNFPIPLDVKKSHVVDRAKEGLNEYAKKYPDSKVEVAEIIEAL